MILRHKNSLRSAVRFAALLLGLCAALVSCGIIIPPRNGYGTDSSDADSLTQEGTAQPPSGTGGEATPVTTADNKTAAKNLLGSLVSHDFDGVAIIIAAADQYLFTPENDGAPATAARLERNAAIEKKYNTVILTKLCGSVDTMLGEAKEAKNSGMYYSDLIAVPYPELGRFVAENLLINLNSLPFTDYTQPYYNKGAIKQMSAGYNVYGAAGALTEDISYGYVTLFNRTLIKEHNAENPYIAAVDGTWTWDRLSAIIKTVNGDIDAAGGTAVYGHAAPDGADNYIDIMYASSGQHFIQTGVGAAPRLSYGERAENFIKTARSLLFDGSRLDAGAADSMSAFYSGGVIFYANRLYTSLWFTNMKNEWGILPLPKLTEEQAVYSTYVDSSVPVMAVLAGGADAETAGIFLQAAEAASYLYINDSYYAYLANNAFRDNDSINMLDYVRQSFWYDFAFMFGSYKYIPDGTYMLLRSSVKNGALSRSYSEYASLIDGTAKKYFSIP